MLRLTNAERADVIDALSEAMRASWSLIDCNTLDGDPATADPGLIELLFELKAQIPRWRILRRRYLKEEERVNQCHT